MQFKLISINGHKQDISKVNDLYGSGYGAYESFRLHDGKVFLLDEHFDRMRKNLQALDIAWDDDRLKYCSWITDLCRDLPDDKDAFVRFSVFLANSEPKVSIHAAYINFFSPKSYQAQIIENPRLTKPEYFEKTGFRVKTADYIKQNSDIKKAVGLDKDTDGILLTPEGNIAEALSANIVWAKDGDLFTPPLETGILSGTMRAYLMKNNEINEVLAKPEELEAADEIILTSGASYLRPLSKINNHKKPGADGPVFKKLYNKLIKDIEKLSKPI